MFSVPLALIGAVIFPIVMHAGWSSRGVVLLQTIAGHATATMAAAAFAFFTLVALHGGLQCVLGQRTLRRVSAVVQLTMTLGLVVALFMLPFIASSTAALKGTAGTAGGYAPQMWFMGIYETIAGQGDAAWGTLAARGWTGLALSAALALLFNILAYRRVLGTTLEAVQTGIARRSWAARGADALACLVVRHPIERGFFSFTVFTLLRSPWHRVLLAAFAGVALALSIVALDLATLAQDGVTRTRMVASHALAMQFVVLAILLSGVRAAAAAPAELGANWTLRLLDAGQRQRWMAGFRKAVIIVFVTPVVGAMTCAAWLQFGWHTAWTWALASLVFAALAFETLFLGFSKVPFACAFDGTTGTVKVRWYLLAAIFTTAVVGAAEAVALAVRTAWGGGALLALSLAVIAALRALGHRTRPDVIGLGFEERELGTQTLGLGP